MLEYIIVEPEVGASHNRGHKFPFIVSDILCTDNLSLLDTFFADEEEEEEHEEEAEAEGEGDFHKEEGTKDSESFKVEHVGDDDLAAEADQQQDADKSETTQEIEGDSKVQNKEVDEVKEEDKADQVVAEGEQQEEPKAQDAVDSSEQQPTQENVESSSEKQIIEEDKSEDQSDVKLEEEKVNENNVTQENEIPKIEEKASTDQDSNVSTPDSNVESVENTQEDKAPIEESKTNTSEEGESQISQPTENETTAETEQSETENSNEAKIEPAENSNENGQDAQAQEKPIENVDTEEQISDNTPIKESSDKSNQENHNDKEVENEGEQIKDDNEEKENKPVSEPKSKEENETVQKEDQTSQNKSKVFNEESPAEAVEENNIPEKHEEEEKEPVASDQDVTPGQEEQPTEDSESNGVFYDTDQEYPAEINEEPIEDALPEEVIDTKPRKDSVGEATQAASEVDPALKKHIIDILFDFVRTEEELNPVLCGYFCKFLYTLMNHNRKGFFAYIYNPESQVVDYMIKHIYNRSISESLIKILSEDCDNVDMKKGFVLKIINSLDTQEYEGKLNSAMVLSDIMDSKAYSEIFKSAEVNKRLFELLKSEDDLTVRATFNFLNVLYKKFPFYRPKPVKDNDEDSFAKMYLPSSQQNGEDMEILDHIDTLLKEELSTIEAIIDHESKEKIGQQYGEIITPFGATKLQATKFITNIITQGNTEYALSLAACLPSLLKYSMDYPWHSMLHNNVEIIFNELFKKTSKYSDEIRTAVIAETGLADFIASLKPRVDMPISGRNIRNGVIATFINIANLLNNHESEYVQEELQKSDKWIEFVHTELQSSNENNERALAGHQSKACDSDEEATNYETSMDKLFAVFTNLKESHDSSRELDDSDEDEQVDTTNILKDIDKSSDGKSSSSKSVDSDSQDEDTRKSKSSKTKEQAKKKSKKCKVCKRSKCQCGTEQTSSEEKKEPESEAKEAQEEVKKQITQAVEEQLSTTDTNIEAPSADVQESQPIAEEAAQNKVEEEAPKKVAEESMAENNTFYDNSYWQLPSSLKLEDLLQDTY